MLHFEGKATRARGIDSGRKCDEDGVGKSGARKKIFKFDNKLSG